METQKPSKITHDDLFCSFHPFLVSSNTIRIFPQIYATNSSLKISDSQSTAKNFFNAKYAEVRQLKKHAYNWSPARWKFNLSTEKNRTETYLIMKGRPFSKPEL